MKKFSVFIFVIIFTACQQTGIDSSNSINVQTLVSVDDVKKAGRQLISLSKGLNKIEVNEQINESSLIITVHGYKSEGYEWINALSAFSKAYSELYFYRYDWNICPDKAGEDLAKSIDSMLIVNENFDNIQIYGHSYGGLLITFAAADLKTDLDTEIHTIAAPLAGYPRIMDSCTLQYDVNTTLLYPTWDTNISHYQWRTQKEQDGAFRDLDFDPQVIELPNSNITLLPDSMDGHRLGHNWSVTWVARAILENE